MTEPIKLRINLNTQALSRTASLISNTAVLTTNLFLIGSGLISHVKERRRERTMETLKMGAQAAQAAAGLTQVMVQIWEHGQARPDL